MGYAKVGVDRFGKCGGDSVDSEGHLCGSVSFWKCGRDSVESEALLQD